MNGYLSDRSRAGTCAAVRACLPLMLTVAVVSSAWAAGNPLWGNVRNAPFAASSDGPQGAIVVPERVSGVLEQAEVASPDNIHRAIAIQHSVAALSQAVEMARYLKLRGVIDPRMDFRFPRTIVHARGRQLLLPDLARATATGARLGDPKNALHFQFVGWSSGDEAALSSYLKDALPVAVAVYGPPAFDLTVKVIRDTTIKALQGGTYDVTTNEIRLPPLSGNFPEDSFVLLLLVLNAFRDDVALFYDSWEQGMIGAAATAVQISPGVSPGYDPANPGPFYSGSVYEPQNQPPLGNSTWYPASGYSGMLVWRIAQARAAWFKCYIENQQFFSRFNSQLYARLNGLAAADRKALLGDTPTLAEIAQSVLPSVEGTPFLVWYRGQYVLDTSISLGTKLFTWNIPLTDAVALIADHYDTTVTGDEIARGGTAHTTYFNYDFTRTLYAHEGNEFNVPSTGKAAGEGFFIATFVAVGDPQRITVQVELNGLMGMYPFAYNVRGFDRGENNLYGAVMGAISGTINVTGLDGLKNVKVDRGVWGGIVSKTVMSPAQLTVSFSDADGNTVARKVNVAFDSYDVLLTAGAQSVFTTRLTVGTNGLHLFSVPVLPLQQDAAAVLGIPANRLLLARWKPTAVGGGKYDVYPNIDPLRPELGYWLRVLADVTIAVNGVVPRDTDDVIAPLHAGWNMVGCPRINGVDVAALLVQRGAGDSKPFPKAVTAGWVQSGVWGYDQTAGYRVVGRVAAWEGYWMRCLVPEGASLIYPAANSVATASEETAAGSGLPLGKLSWQLPLVLEWSGLSSQAVLGGAASGKLGYDRRHDLQSPPAFAAQPTLRFVHRDWGANSGEYVSEIREPAARGPWKLTVTGVPLGRRAVLRWPDLSGVPAALQPVLTDRLTGNEVRMRTKTGYSFAGATRGREFTVELRATHEGALAITSLHAAPTPQGVAIDYHLSVGATTQARVRNLAGRLIRELSTDAPQAAGPSVLLWDRRSATGQLVPNGRYLIELTAHAADGQTATAIAAVTLTR